MSDLAQLLKNAREGARLTIGNYLSAQCREAQLLMIAAFHQRRYEDFCYYYLQLIELLRHNNTFRMDTADFAGARQPIGIGPAPEFKMQVQFELPSATVSVDVLAEHIAEQYHDGWQTYLSQHSEAR